MLTAAVFGCTSPSGQFYECGSAYVQKSQNGHNSPNVYEELLIALLLLLGCI
jgi:hypothetical protein